MGQDKGRETSVSSYCHGQTRLDLRKLIEFIINEKSESDNEKI